MDSRLVALLFAVLALAHAIEANKKCFRSLRKQYVGFHWGACLAGQLCLTIGFGDTCTNPSVSTDTYTSKNIALSTETAYVAEFTVGCQEDTKGFNLYAELEAGHLVPVAYVPESSSYQVSWAKDHKKAVTGAITLKMFNDEGYAAYRKAQRSEGDLSAVAPLFTVTINHPGASREGLFVQTEFIAVVTSLLVWWGANTMRSQIME